MKPGIRLPRSLCSGKREFFFLILLLWVIPVVTRVFSAGPGRAHWSRLLEKLFLEALGRATVLTCMLAEESLQLGDQSSPRQPTPTSLVPAEDTVS